MHKKIVYTWTNRGCEGGKDAMACEMIGHRMKEFTELYNQVIPKLQQVLYTKNRVLLFTSSATGCMESVVRNLSNKKDTFMYVWCIL